MNVIAKTRASATLKAPEPGRQLGEREVDGEPGEGDPELDGVQPPGDHQLKRDRLRAHEQRPAAAVLGDEHREHDQPGVGDLEEEEG